MFIDEVKLNIKAGKGGDGIISWRREKYIPKGGPYGGDGGDGGDIILRATPHETTLIKYRHQKVIRGKDGEKGGTQEMHGANASDTILEVPIGTIVTDLEDGSVIADLTEVGQEFVICEGGRGGFGNAHFPSSTRQAPNFAELGDVGESRDVKLELKLVADVGLVGLPNAGKSTLIQSLTNVRPKIADYAFTTITPNLGVMEWKGKSLVIEDVPGLIEGASEGKGLGFQFLKHIDRCQMIIHLLDASQGEEAIVENYQTIRKELEKWGKKSMNNEEGRMDNEEGTMKDEEGKMNNDGLVIARNETTQISETESPYSASLHSRGQEPSLADKEELIIFSKADIIDAEQLEEMIVFFEKKTGKKVTLTISAGAYIRIDELKDMLIAKIPEKAEVPESKSPKTQESKFYDLKTRKSDPKRCHIERLDNGDFRVTGERIEEIARMTDTRYVDGVNRVYDVLEKLGVMRKIKLTLTEEIASGKGQGFFEGEDDFDVPDVWIGDKKFSLEGLIFMKEEKK